MSIPDAHPLYREERPGTGKVAYSLGLNVPNSVSGTIETGRAASLRVPLSGSGLAQVPFDEYGITTRHWPVWHVKPLDQLGTFSHGTDQLLLGQQNTDPFRKFVFADGMECIW